MHPEVKKYASYYSNIIFKSCYMLGYLGNNYPNQNYFDRKRELFQWRQSADNFY